MVLFGSDQVVEEDQGHVATCAVARQDDGGWHLAKDGVDMGAALEVGVEDVVQAARVWVFGGCPLVQGD